MDQIIELIARLDALCTTSDIYHWGCQGPNFFADHQFFNTIKDTLSEYIDKLAECYIMNFGRDVITHKLYDSIKNKPEEYFGKPVDTTDEMLDSIKDLIVNIQNIINDKFKTGARGVDSIIDALSEDLLKLNALLKARLEK